MSPEEHERFRPRNQYAPFTKAEVEEALQKHKLKVVGYHGPKPGEWFLGKCALDPHQWQKAYACAYPCIIVEKRV